MEVKGNRQYNTEKRPFIFFVISLLAGLFTAMLFQSGIFVIPFCSASLSALFLSERKGKRVLSYVSPIILLLLDIIFNSFYSLNCLASVIVAVVIYFCYVKERSKGECAVYLTLILSFFTVISFVLVGFFLTETVSIDAVVDFYKEQFELLREQFGLIIEQLAAQGTVNTEIFTDEYVSNMFVSVYNSLSALIAVFAFALCGLSLKIFSRMTSRVDNNERNNIWFFETNSLYAYFFVVLVVLSFLNTQNEFFGIFVANLTTVFMFVYAYIGYKFVSAIFASRGLFSKLLLVAGILLFSSAAIQILSYIGVYFMIIAAKRKDADNS